MTGVPVTIRVDDDEVLRLLRRVEGGLDRLVEEVAEELADEAAREGRSVSSRLGAKWPVSGTGDETRHVEAPEWWAHFIAGGTKDHGARSAPRLAFTIDSRFVTPTHVRGIAPNPFDERAIRTTEHRVDDIVRRLIGLGGLF